MKQDDDLFRFFDIPLSTSPPKDGDLPATIDATVLAVVECEDGPRAVDVSLGLALSYERPRAIRQLIERYENKLLEFGRLPHRMATSHTGSGARDVKQYLLNQGQVNYLITRSNLPNADAACVLIAKVFTAWQDGKLLAQDLPTAIELRDAEERLADISPQLNNIFVAVTKCATKNDLQCTEINISAKINDLAGRQDPTAKTMALQLEVVANRYGGLCPCCGKRLIVVGGIKTDGCRFDHWFKPSKNGVYEVWPICDECNRDFETEKMPRFTKGDEWAVFGKRVKEAIEQSQPSFPINT